MLEVECLELHVENARDFDANLLGWWGRSSLDDLQ